MKSLYDLKKYAETGIAAPGMTAFDKMRALSAFGGFPVKTLTGVPPLTFQSDGTALTAWSISGNLTQTGTPTPSAPIQPEETGDRTANLFDKDNADIFHAYISGLQSRWVLSDDSRSIKIPCKPSTIYTFSTSTEIPVFRVAESQAENAEPSQLGEEVTVLYNVVNSNECTVTTSANAKWLIFQGSATLFDVWMSELMINTGSTALPYVPFGYAIPITLAGQTQTIYLTEPLRKIGYYCDTVEQDGTVTRMIKKWVLSGQERWSKYNSRLIVARPSDMPNSTTSILSSHFMLLNGAGQPGTFYVESSNVNFNFDGSNDIDEWKTYLADQYAAGTPVCVLYVLANPVTETVTVPTLTPTKCSNTLSVETTLSPSEVGITGHIKAV